MDADVERAGMLYSESRKGDRQIGVRKRTPKLRVGMGALQGSVAGAVR